MRPKTKFVIVEVPVNFDTAICGTCLLKDDVPHCGVSHFADCYLYTAKEAVRVDPKNRLWNGEQQFLYKDHSPQTSGQSVTLYAVKKDKE